MKNVEELLDDLVQAQIDAGTDVEDIISAMELKIMALREEHPR